LENDVNVASKSNKQKPVENFFICYLEGQMKIAGSGAGSESQLCGSGSVPKCHGSATLAINRFDRARCVLIAIYCNATSLFPNASLGLREWERGARKVVFVIAFSGLGAAHKI
jgi:hypothetical protein